MTLALIAVFMVSMLFIGTSCKQEAAPAEEAVEEPAVEEPVAEEEVVVEEVDPASFEGEFDVWAFNEEVSGFAEKFMEVYPNVKVNTTIIPFEEYPTKVETVLGSGKGVPDVFVGEIQWVKKWVEGEAWLDLSSTYNADELAASIVEYVKDVARDADGNLRGLSWQATPGAVFYRRSMAEKYFGTQDPDEVSALMTTMDDYIDMGRTIRDMSNGEDFLVAGWGDIHYFAISLSTDPWVKDGKLVISQSVLDFFDQAKTIRDEGLDNKISQWSSEWFAGFNSNIFSYLLPTWGLLHVVEPAITPPEEPAEGVEYTFGDWGLTSGPAPYFWGGTWMGIYKDSEKADLAWEFIKFVTLNEEFLTEYAIESGDYVSNLNVVDAIVGDLSRESLGGQNHYAFFKQEAENIDASNVTKYDGAINVMLLSAIGEYVEGIATKEQAIENFKENVASAFPEVSVD